MTRITRQQLETIGRILSPEAVAASESLCAADAAAAQLPAGAQVDRDLHYGTDPRHRLDLFRPARGERPPAVLVFVHGGGFIGGDKRKPGSPMYANVGHWAVAAGCAAANINYRLAPGHVWPAAAQDISQALQWLRAQQDPLRLDASRIVLVGHSAGAAHVASYLAGHAGECDARKDVVGAVLLSGIYDVPAMAQRPSVQACYGTDPALHPRQSSLETLAAAEYPLLVTVAEYDPEEFQAQGLALVNRIAARQGRLPQFTVAAAHNHYTQVFQLGARDSRLGDLLADFVRDCTAPG